MPHRSMRDDEQSNNWFAAEFHLRYLKQEAPNDPAIEKRWEQARAKLREERNQ